MNKYIVSILSFIFSIFLGQTVFANSWDCGKHMEEMTASLKLDHMQQEKIKAIKAKLKSNLKSTREQSHALRMQINQQIMSDNMNQSEVDKLINKKVELIGNMMKEKAMAKHQMYELLNAQQKTKYQQMHKQWEEKMMKKYEKCHK